MPNPARTERSCNSLIVKIGRGEQFRAQLIYTNVEREFIDFKKSVRPNMDKEYIMKKNIGLWIDHREAVIVVVTDKDEQITRIKSDSEKQTRLPGGSRKDGLQQTENIRDKKFDKNLGQFYDNVITKIREAELIQIFGPGEAKGELVKSLEEEGLKERIAEVETVDNMTDNQIVAKVRERFSTSSMPAK